MKTLYDKLWEEHHVTQLDSGESLLYIDRHYLHEVTSPQAFEGLAKKNLKPWRLGANIATPDHNVPTTRGNDFNSNQIKDEISKIQVVELDKNCNTFGIKQFDIKSSKQGIVHVIGPELGYTLPGMTIVCGDSHTSTHGALGCLAMGIGTSEVEHVLATQTLIQKPAKNMLVEVNGDLPKGVTAKDIILEIIGRIGTAGGTGYVIEYAGSAIRNLSMEGRMTICNMSIEAGARAGMIAPDEKTYEYLEGRPMSPSGDNWNKALEWWKSLPSDKDAVYDKKLSLDAEELVPTVTWGTSPEDTAPINGKVPDPKNIKDEALRSKIERSIAYMDLKPGQKITDIKIDTVFIGSCTNSRIEDLRAASKIVAGKKVSKEIRAMIVPGSGLVKEQAEKEGLDSIFKDAGFDWREPGCSMCLAMNADRLSPGERAASTSNRNFEGRQGRLGRTHLVSPEMAAAAAISGFLTDVRDV